MHGHFDFLAITVFFVATMFTLFFELFYGY